MPQLGEIQRVQQYKRNGIKGGYKAFVWHACEVCGKTRWVKFERGKPRNLKCVRCSNLKGNPLIFNNRGTIANPVLGDIRRSNEVGYIDPKRCIWAACEVCGKERWVPFIKGHPATKRCIKCIHIGKGHPCRYTPKATKFCRRCGETYPNTIEFFVSSKATKSGLGACRKCKRLDRAERLNNNRKLRLSRTMSNHINQTLRNGKNGHHWETLVGYTINELIAHLESQFIEDMNWENYGVFGWHIDHKIPICAFNFEKPEDVDFKRCWALGNLQPLWALDNESKGGNIQGAFQPSLVL